MTRPTERYALLIDQLGTELGHVRGWKKRVALRLGVHPSYVSRILSGEKLSIGPDVIDRACERLGISEEFFFAELPGEPHYREFLPDRRAAALDVEIADEHERWREAHQAALAFLRTASDDRSSTEIAAQARELLDAVRKLPMVRHAFGLAAALERREERASWDEAWKLTGAILVETSRSTGGE